MRKGKSDHLIPIQSLFEKYKKVLIAPQKSVENEAALIIRKKLNIPSTVNIKLVYQPSTRVLYIKTTLLKYSVIKIKTELICELRKNLGEKSSPLDIL